MPLQYKLGRGGRVSLSKPVFPRINPVEFNEILHNSRISDQEGRVTQLTLCTQCKTDLLAPSSFARLFASGLKFSVSSEDFLDPARKACRMCMFVFWILASGELGYYPLSIDGSPTSLSIRGMMARHEGGIQIKLELDNGNDEIFSVESPKDDPASEFISSRPQKVTERARKWLLECTESHAACRESETRHMPTRVLDLNPQDGNSSLRLLKTYGQRGKYATLSYCWGGDQANKLKAERLAPYMMGIDEAALPRTIQDAISVTRDLGLRFLWIDAYCIVQDCEEDKLVEISRMHSIFRNSFVTIAASGAPSAIDGFLELDVSPSYWPIPIRLPNGLIGKFLLKHWPHALSNSDPEPIERRAWTLEENLLSRRVLQFPSSICKVLWQCDTVVKSEYGTISGFYCHSWKRLLKSVLSQQSTPSSQVPVHRLCYKWAQIIENFSHRILTDPADKLPAIGGIAAEFHRVWGGHYYAGLWSNFILSQLLWSTKATFDDPLTYGRRPKTYRAPTWSWASCDGDLILPRLPNLSPNNIEVLDCNVTLVDEAAPFGAVIAGSLTVRGLLKDAIVHNGFLYDLNERHTPIGTSNLDIYTGSRQFSVSLNICCLAVEKETGDISDCETLCSETSADYEGEIRGLLLTQISGREEFERVGIFEKNGYNAMDEWFDDCIPKTITIL